MSKRKIYVIGGLCGYSSWMEGEPTHSMEDADLVVLTGGQDINPALYGCKPHPTTFFTPQRDEFELEEYREAFRLGKPIIGICRGAQLLCAMAGGKLIQNMSHPPMHKIETYDGEKFSVTSCHHQMQWPWELPSSHYKVLGWCKPLSPYHHGETNKNMRLPGGTIPPEVEVALYPNIKGLGIQGHPEWMEEGSAAIHYFRRLLTKFIEGSV